MFATDAGHLLVLGLVVLALVLGIAVATSVVLAGRRDPRRRPAPRGAAVGSPLSRLEYLPAVTSRAPRLSWHGSRRWSIGGRSARPPLEDERELIGSRASAPVAGHADALAADAPGGAPTRQVAPIDETHASR